MALNCPIYHKAAYKLPIQTPEYQYKLLHLENADELMIASNNQEYSSSSQLNLITSGNTDIVSSNSIDFHKKAILPIR